MLQWRHCISEKVEVKTRTKIKASTACLSPFITLGCLSLFPMYPFVLSLISLSWATWVFIALQPMSGRPLVVRPMQPSCSAHQQGSPSTLYALQPTHWANKRAESPLSQKTAVKLTETGMFGPPVGQTNRQTDMWPSSFATCSLGTLYFQ